MNIYTKYCQSWTQLLMNAAFRWERSLRARKACVCVKRRCVCRRIALNIIFQSSSLRTRIDPRIWGTFLAWYCPEPFNSEVHRGENMLPRRRKKTAREMRLLRTRLCWEKLLRNTDGLFLPLLAFLRRTAQICLRPSQRDTPMIRCYDTRYVKKKSI